MPVKSGNEASAIGLVAPLTARRRRLRPAAAVVAMRAVSFSSARRRRRAHRPSSAPTWAATATVTKSGYTIDLGVGGTAAVAGVLSCNGGAAVNSGYTAAADPVSTSTGTRNFASDNRGTIFFANGAAVTTAAAAIPAAAVPIQ